MDLIHKALEFETRKMRFPTTSDRIMAAREAKSLILSLNEIYKENKDSKYWTDTLNVSAGSKPFFDFLNKEAYK